MNITEDSNLKLKYKIQVSDKNSKSLGCLWFLVSVLQVTTNLPDSVLTHNLPEMMPKFNTRCNRWEWDDGRTMSISLKLDGSSLAILKVYGQLVLEPVEMKDRLKYG